MLLAAWIPTAISAALLAAFYFVRKWIEANVEKSVQHTFDQKLEVTKSDLRAKEAEISALRDMVLSGRAQRNALLDKRRIEAVERIWAAVGRLAPFLMTSASMAVVEFDVAAKDIPRNPNLRTFFSRIADPSLVDKLKEGHVAIHERPFLSPLAWAYFSAYQSILFSAYMDARVLAEVVADAGKFLNRNHARDLLKATLSHHSEWIDSNDPSTYHYLLDELREKLLGELRNMLTGQDEDRQAIQQAKQINDILSKIEEEERASDAKAAAQLSDKIA